MHCCDNKCGKITAVIILALGVLFLLADLDIWTFFGETISGWTVLFILIGIIGLACNHNHCEGNGKVKTKK